MATMVYEVDFYNAADQETEGYFFAAGDVETIIEEALDRAEEEGVIWETAAVKLMETEQIVVQGCRGMNPADWS